MEKQYFTFGQGTAFRNMYVEAVAPNAEACRTLMIEVFDTRWAFQYDADKDFGIDRFGLEKLCTLIYGSNGLPTAVLQYRGD